MVEFEVSTIVNIPQKLSVAFDNDAMLLSLNAS